MKICILADPADQQLAGVASAARGLIKELKKSHRFEYHFIHSKKDPLFDGASHTVVSELPSVLRFFRKLFILPFVLKKQKPGIVHELAHIGPLIMPGKYKRVVTIHDITPILFPKMHTFFNRLSHKLLLKRALKKADAIIVPSHATRKDLENFFTPSKEKIHVIPWGIKEIAPVPEANFQVEGKWGIKGPYILFVGTLEPRKQVDILLKAFEALAAEMPDIKLVLVGKYGWHCKKLQREIASSPVKNRIIMPGYVPEKDLPIFYSGASVFVYPSLYEGFGFPPLEAMKCGCPVIVSESSSLPEVVGDAGITVSISTENLSGAIMKLLKNPVLQNSLKEKGLKRAAEFSWKKCAESTEKVYESLLEA